MEHRDWCRRPKSLKDVAHSPNNVPKVLEHSELECLVASSSRPRITPAMTVESSKSDTNSRQSN